MSEAIEKRRDQIFTMSDDDYRKYHSVFQNSMSYGGSMTGKDQNKFNFLQYNDIQSAIGKALQFIHYSDYDFGDEYENVRIYAVACLPFITAKFDIENPDIEDRNYRKKTLEWLSYIKNNKRWSDYLLNSITNNDIGFDDFNGIEMENLDKQIEYYEWSLSGTKTTKREWWSNVLLIEYFAKTIDIALDSLKDKLDFLYTFFSEFDKDVNPDSIEKQMIHKARQNPMISYTDSHIQKILDHPLHQSLNDDKTDKQVIQEYKNKILNPLIDRLLPKPSIPLSPEVIEAIEQADDDDL